MRLFAILTISAAALFSPGLAAAEPAQASGGGAAQTAATSTMEAQPSAVSQPSSATAQAPAVPAQAPTPTKPQTGPESVVVRADANAVDLDQIVCKEAPPKTGSRLGGGRECQTQREWNRQMRESQDITRHQQVLGYSSK